MIECVSVCECVCVSVSVCGVCVSECDTNVALVEAKQSCERVFGDVFWVWALVARFFWWPGSSWRKSRKN